VYALALRNVFQSYQRTRELWLGVGLQDLVLVALAPTAIVCLVGVLGAKRKAFLTAAVGHGFLAMQCLAIPIALWLAISCGIGLTARTPGQPYPSGLQTLLIVMMLCEVVRGACTLQLYCPSADAEAQTSHGVDPLADASASSHRVLTSHSLSITSLPSSVPWF
jgi:hypothetical protein